MRVALPHFIARHEDNSFCAHRSLLTLGYPSGARSAVTLLLDLEQEDEKNEIIAFACQPC
jgi:hypothetical protein